MKEPSNSEIKFKFAYRTVFFAIYLTIALTPFIAHSFFGISGQEISHLCGCLPPMFVGVLAVNVKLFCSAKDKHDKAHARER